VIVDMEAFMAANAGCKLEDFVRWHSPRDWVEAKSPETVGRLSDRMTEPGNLWNQCWQVCQLM
jgi:Rab3 GTPase-activating protein catalytic subunit